MATSSSCSNGSQHTDTVMEAAESRGSRGIKRSASHMDLEELPEEQKENECQDRKVKKPMTQYEVNISWPLICVIRNIRLNPQK